MRCIDFNITIEEAWELFLKQDKKCALTKQDLNFAKGKINWSIQTASLDRIDSSKPYSMENCQWLHKDVNFMKNKFTQEYFIEICGKIWNNRK